MVGISHINNERIPNNVHLSDDKRLQRALLKWQPAFIDWWKEMGPEGFLEKEIYLRTAVSVDTNGWANFGYVKMPDYRWGIFLTPPEKDRRIPCGDNAGKETWKEIPGEFRNPLRRLIVTQADTEPASVEQQRILGQTAPSLYDLRNLFQVNVEEGRHLWAMVYLLHSYFGRDGREEADTLLERRSGDADKPRILNTFNEPIEDWLSFYMFANFTDRDGKFQLLALAESAFEPLARTTRFMLTEEAHHLFVGQTGIQRVIRRSCELMNAHQTEDIAPFGGVPLKLIQKYINFWFSSSVDLFGSELSSNAATYFAAGLKGRAYEGKLYTDHVAKAGHYNLEQFHGGKVSQEEAPLRNAMNEVLRDAYIYDNEKGVAKWNKEIAKQGVNFEMKLPSRRFNRTVGAFSEATFSPEGELISKEAFEKFKDTWLPTQADKTFVKSLMKQSIGMGQIANWIAPPLRGINGNAFEFEYVKM